VGPRAGVERCGNSHPHRDSISEASSTWQVAIPGCLLLPVSKCVYKSWYYQSLNTYGTLLTSFFFFMAQQPNSGLDRLVLRFLDHIKLDTGTPGRTNLNEYSTRRRGGYLHNTQQTRERNSRGLSGIRTCLRPHDHWDKRAAG
jgi:hypothetical protein